MSYCIKDPLSNRNIVELWSSKRLPFEPKGWQHDMRASLRTAISRLVVDDNSILIALYKSSDKNLCDIDNILFYNIGSAVFENVCYNGFFLERSFGSVNQLSEKSEIYSHYMRYEFFNQNRQPVYWKIKKELASWKNLKIKKLTSISKAHMFWQVFKENQISVFTDKIYDGYYGIEIELVLSKNDKINSAILIKPLLDGVISAFHSYEGNQLEEVSERLAIKLSENAEYISTLLVDKTISIFGSRCVLHPFKNYVQWNPSDDKCVIIKLICKYIENNNSRMISGRLFEVE